MSALDVKKTSSFTEGPLIKKMILFALPLVATSIILQLFNTVDMALAGRFISKDALAAIGSTSTVSGFFIEFFLGFSTATNVVVAQFLGNGDKEGANRAIKTSVLFALACGLFIAVTGFYSSRYILELMKVPGNIIDAADTYLRIYFLGMPFFMMYNFCAAVFRSRGDTKTPMLCLVIGGVLKICLNLIFIKLFNAGVTGMAISTVCSNALTSFLLLMFMSRKDEEVRFDLKPEMPCMDIVRILLKIGLPAAFLGSVFSISNMCVQSAINSLGSDVIAASSAAASIEIYIQFFGNAFQQAAVTFTSQNYGAGKIKRLNKVTVTAIVLCNAVTIVLTVVTFVFSKRLLHLFVTDSIVIAFAIMRMKYTLLSKPIQAVMDIMSGCLQGYGYTLVPALVSMFGVCGVRLLWIYTVFVMNPTLGMLMSVYPITQAIAAISHTVCYFVIQKRIKAGKMKALTKK